MRNSRLTFLLFVLFALGIQACSTAQHATSASDKVVNKWFNDGAWAGGLKLKVYADVDKREFYTQYHKNKARWDKAFAYLKEHDLVNHPLGKTLIEGDSLFISVTVAPDKELDKTNWESHEKFIDLQYIVVGKEEILVNKTSNLKVTKPYDATRDVANYAADGKGKSYIAEPGTYYLFFPNDAHRPSIKVDGYGDIWKAVVKIGYTK